MITWTPAEQLPLDDSDCLVIYTLDRADPNDVYTRAPVFYHDEKLKWIDEWGHELDVIKYCLIPDL